MFVTHFSDRLLSGEKVIWSGRPAQGILLVASDWFVIPFSLVWLSFAVFWEMGAIAGKTPAAFPLFGMLFVFVGIYILIGRFVFDSWRRSNTWYVLTSRRILILRKGIFGKLTALRLDQIPDINISERSDGRCTICFGEPVRVWNPNFGIGLGIGGGSASVVAPPQFTVIENARLVFNKIQSAVDELR